MSFLFIVLFVFVSLHFFVYFSVLRFFSLSAGAKFSLGVTILFLLVSVVVSMMFLRFSDIFILNYYYLISSFWIGLVINLSIFFALAWIISFLMVDAKTFLGVGAILCAVLFSFFGLWNSRNPIVREVSISVDGLPESWKGKQVVQISDAHLGRMQGPSFAKKLVSKVNDLNVEAVFVTGDLFDGMGDNVEGNAKIMGEMKSKKGTYFVTGNHEVYLGKQRALEAAKNAGFNILDNRVVDVSGLQLVGLGYNNFGDTRESGFISNLEGFQKNKPTILLYHSPASIVEDGGEREHSSIYWSPKIGFDEVKNSGVDVQLSGHTHNGQIIPFNFLVDFIYGDYANGLKKDGNFSVYVSSGAGVWGTPMRTWGRSEIVLITLR